MRRVLFISTDQASQNVECPVGSRIRILAVDVAVSGAAANDQLFIVFLRSAATVVSVCSAPLDASVATIAAFIGAGIVPGVLNSSTALPNCWWDFTVTITTNSNGGMAIQTTRIAYEVDDGQ